MKHKCSKCNHEWESSLEEPKSCPRCKRYDWKNGVVSGNANLEVKEKSEIDLVKEKSTIPIKERA